MTSAGHRPLQGIRVLDFGWVWSAPLAGAVLADLGAEVIKVESSKRLDPNRLRSGDMGAQDKGLVSFSLFRALNRGKRSLTLNLKHPGAIDIIHQLLAKSDVVLENYSPGVMERQGLGYDVMRGINPGLIVISMAAAGQTGPLSEVRGYAPSISCLGGLDSLSGYPGEEVLGMMNLGLSDSNAGIVAALGILAALAYRQRTGLGQYLDMSQVEAVTATIGEAILEYQVTGRVPGPRGNAEGDFCPHGHYPCRGDDEWVAIAVTRPSEWEGLRRALGDPAWAADPGLATPVGRLARQEEVEARIEAWTMNRTAPEVTEALILQGVPASPVNRMEAVRADPSIRARGVWAECDSPLGGRELQPAVPWRLSKTPPAIRGPAPRIGDAVESILTETLGYDSATVARLRDEGALS